MLAAKKKQAKSGYSCVELMFTMVLVGVISVIAIPSLIYKTENTSALLQTKLIAIEILRAAQKYKQANPGAIPGRGEYIADFMKHVGKVDSNTPGIKLFSKSEQICSTLYPCYRFPDGGALVTWSIGIEPDDEPIYHFTYDPDGKNEGVGEDLGTVTLILDYEKERITTYGAITGNYKDDPHYVRSWTKLNP